MLKVAIEGKNRTTYDTILAEIRSFFESFGATEKL